MTHSELSRQNWNYDSYFKNEFDAENWLVRNFYRRFLKTTRQEGYWEVKIIENIGSSFQPKGMGEQKDEFNLSEPRKWEEIWIQTTEKGALPGADNFGTSLEMWNTIWRLELIACGKNHGLELLTGTG